MIELTRGLSFVLYTYEGGPLRFTVPFPYLEREHVKVFVGEPDSARLVASSWINANTIEIPTQEGMLTVPFTVTLRRVTPYNQLAIAFRDGANLPARDLNKALHQLLYAHQEAIDFGENGGLPGGGDPGGIPDINAITDQVMRSPALQELLERTDLIDMNAETILEDILRSHGFNDAERFQAARNEKTEVELTETKSRVEHTETVVAQHGGNIAAVQQAVVAHSDAISANAELRQALAVRFSSTPDGESLAAAVDQRFTVEASAREAVAEAVETLQVTTKPIYFGDVAPEGSDFAVGSHWIKTGQTGAYLAHVWDGTQWLKNDLDTSSPTGALVQNLSQTKIDADQAQSIVSTQLQAFKDGDFATIREEFDVVAGQHAGMYGQWQAEWSIKINAGSLNGVPVIAGVSLSANPATGSDFVIMADRMAIVHPQYTSGGTLATLRYPFVVGTVGGVSTVGIQGQLVVDGTITADKIQVNTLSAITANMGTVNGGTFKTHTLNAQGQVIDALEFRAEFTNVGDFPIWVGEGAKTKNNAVFWVDRLGNAGFDGVISAPNITSQLQAIQAIAWMGAVIPKTAYIQEIVQFTLPGPVRVGETHTPLICLAVNIQSLHGINGIVELQVARLVNGSWTTFHRSQLNQGSGHGVNHALNVLAPATGSSVSYRVACISMEGEDRLQIQGCTGFAIGIR